MYISIGLTAFVLAMVAGVMTTVRGMGSTDTSVAVSAAAPITLDARQAASAASQYLNRTDIYSVETASISGTLGYKVVFSSGDVVYVGMDGQILATEKIEPVVTLRTVQNQSSSIFVPASSGSSVSQGEHESSEHESEEHESGDHD
jgi:hypothetical protein